MIDDGHAIAKSFRFFDVVRGQDDGLLLSLEFLNDIVNFSTNLWIEAGSRFVEEKNLGIIYQRHGQREPLFLPARKLVVKRVTLFFQPETFSSSSGFRPRL